MFYIIVVLLVDC